jgi:hypothetical protein
MSWYLLCSVAGDPHLAQKRLLCLLKPARVANHMRPMISPEHCKIVSTRM